MFIGMLQMAILEMKWSAITDLSRSHTVLVGVIDHGCRLLFKGCVPSSLSNVMVAWPSVGR